MSFRYHPFRTNTRVTSTETSEDEKLNLIPIDEDPFGSIFQPCKMAHKDKAPGIDMISTLPEDMIFHIFSFLPAKSMVQCSILSTRWRYLWTLNPCINFKDDEWGLTPTNYIAIVNGVLSTLSCLRPPTITKFMFKFTKYYDIHLVDAWLDSALLLDAREIELEVQYWEQFMLSRSICTSNSLATLKLNIQCYLQVSSFVYFPTLKSLHLTHIRMVDHLPPKNLFSSCPRLQELIINSCPWETSQGFEISIDSLERLVITDPPPLLSGSRKCEVVINAPKLSSFEYKGYFATYYTLENTRLLADAFIDLDYDRMSWNDRHGSSVAKLLRAISSVKTLKLTDHTLGNLFYASEVEPNLFPAFYNLKHLELTGIAGSSFIKVLLHLLQRAPALESLVVSTDFYIFEGHHNDWKPEDVPQCVCFQLKAITVRNFRGDVEEFQFVEYFVKNAQALEMLTIVSLNKCSAGSEEQMELSKKISRLPVISRKAVVLISASDSLTRPADSFSLKTGK